MAAEDPDVVLVGRVVKPHGLSGEVLIRSLTENPDRFRTGARLLMGADPGSAGPVVVAGARNHKDALLVQFDGVTSVEEAEELREHLLFVDLRPVYEEELREHLLFVDRSEVGALEEEGAFWEHEVVGLEVVDTAGKPLGRISSVLSRPAQDLWTIESASGEVLFPAAKELVVSVDLPGGRVVVDPPEGLFEA